MVIKNGMFKNTSSLQTVKLGNRITEIESEAFFMCSSLESVTLGDNITSIGSRAFAYCSNLLTIKLPKNLKVIGSGVFMSCTKLTGFEIPEALEKIESGAFLGCSSLNSITIPAGLSEFDPNVFVGCSIYNVYVNSENPYYSSIDSVLYSKDQKTLIHYPSARSDAEYTVPSGTEVIGSYAFSAATKIKSVILPATVEVIEDMAFFSCAGLEGIELASVKEIGLGAFTLCVSLKSVTIPDSVTTIGDSAFAMASLNTIYIGKGLTSLGEFVFEGCPITVFEVSPLNETYSVIDGNLYSKDGTVLIQYALGKNATEFTVPEGVTVIDGGAFAFSNLEKIYLPSTLITIKEDAFSYCSLLEEITIPKSVTTVEPGAFKECYALTAIKVENGNSIYMSYNGDLYTKDWSKLIAYAIGKADTNFDVPIGVEEICELAFYKAQNLKTVTVVEGVVKIGSNAFFGSSIQTIILPASLEEIDAFAFGECEYLTSVEFKNTNGWYMCEIPESGPIDTSKIIAKEVLEDTSAAAELLTENASMYWRIMEA